MSVLAGWTRPGRWMAAILSLVAVAGWSKPSRAEGVKIGYFDVKQILAEVDEASDIKKRLQVDFEKKQKQLDEQKAAIDAKQAEIRSKESVLSPSALDQLKQELSDMVMKAQKLYGELQQELQGKEQQALGELLGKLSPVVQEIALEEGYTYVFEKNEAGLFYGPAQHDLTAQLIRKYNQRHPAGSGGADKTKAKAKPQ